MADRDELVRAFQKAASDFVLAQVAFNNAILAARKAGVTDREMAMIAGMPDSEIEKIPSTH